MVEVRDVAAGIAHYLGKELQLDVKNTDMVRFGVELFLAFLVGFGVLIGVAWGLGILPYVLTAWFTLNGLRIISGGAHASSLFRCTIIGTVILTGIGELAFRFGALASQELLLSLVAFSMIVGVYVIYKWSPADTPAKPVVSAVKRARFRRFSYIFTSVWVVGMSVLIFWGGSPIIFSLVMASIGGFLRQIFSITPAGYRFIAAVEIVFDKCAFPFRQ
ncbi:accessory gene regulator ArgB-like protein [Pelosinus fermentans]|uniref:Accessory regulator B n=1 Tax=Pelosinus fermentans JBW45 TaxID=1192197 RepID=I8TY60_9FIRM|nr:accessory gene regulator B family protein [Pelosinus fermentans]AJQ29992.1 Accessory regulator B [Pelosinus fermentans JBW45]